MDGSVRRIDNPSTRSLVNDATVAPSLAGANNVRCIVEDASGRLYFGTTSGVIEVNPGTGDTRRYTVDAAKLSTGTHTLTWQVRDVAGHVTKRSMTFTIRS